MYWQWQAWTVVKRGRGLLGWSKLSVLPAGTPATVLNKVSGFHILCRFHVHLFGSTQSRHRDILWPVSQVACVTDLCKSVSFCSLCIDSKGNWPMLKSVSHWCLTVCTSLVQKHWCASVWVCILSPLQVLDDYKTLTTGIKAIIHMTSLPWVFQGLCARLIQLMGVEPGGSCPLSYICVSFCLP